MTTALAVSAPTWVASIEPVITTPEEYRAVSSALLRAKTFQHTVADFFAPHKKSAKAAWQGLIDAEKDALASCYDWEARAKRALADYDTAQERIRRAEQARREAEARRAAEEAALDEAVRLEAEGRAQQDATKLAAAERVIEAPVVPKPVLPVPSQTPKADGISYRELWDARVVDFAAFARWALAQPKPEEFLSVNTAAVRSLARLDKDKLQVPGLEAYSTKSVAAR